MKNLLLAMALAALSLTAVLVTLAVTRNEDDGQAGHHDPGQPAPETVTVLSGKKDGLEVMVLPRFVDGERRRYTDITFTRGLGIRAGKWTYLEIVVVNGRDVEVTGLDPSHVVLTATDGSPVPARDLRTLAADGAAARLLLEAFAPPSDRPLAPKTTRRIVVAMPAARTFDELAWGEWLGVDIRPGRAQRRALESWLGRERPGARFLQAVLEDPKEKGGRDGR